MGERGRDTRGDAGKNSRTCLTGERITTGLSGNQEPKTAPKWHNVVDDGATKFEATVAVEEKAAREKGMRDRGMGRQPEGQTS